jgi:hypothetical protein
MGTNIIEAAMGGVDPGWVDNCITYGFLLAKAWSIGFAMPV